MKYLVCIKAIIQIMIIATFFSLSAQQTNQAAFLKAFGQLTRNVETISAFENAVRPNSTASFPISIGRITISDSGSAPFYSFNQVSLTPNNTNILLDAQKAYPASSNPTIFDSIVPGQGILSSLTDSAITAQGFTIQATDNPDNFFKITATYKTAVDSNNFVVSRLLTLAGKSPYVTCELQFNIQAFIQKLINSPNILQIPELVVNQPSQNNRLNPIDIEFKWILINLSFDTGGSFFVIDSLDIHYTYKFRKQGSLPGALTAHISREVGLRKKRLNDLWNDTSIFNSSCFAPAE